MTQEDFSNEVKEILSQIEQTLIIKGKEYVRNDNPFHNFEAAARMNESHPCLELHGFLTKHLISYMDMLNDIDAGRSIKLSQVNEKLGDILVYFIIQKIQLSEYALSKTV